MKSIKTIKTLKPVKAVNSFPNHLYSLCIGSLLPLFVVFVVSCSNEDQHSTEEDMGVKAQKGNKPEQEIADVKGDADNSAADTNADSTQDDNTQEQAEQPVGNSLSPTGNANTNVPASCRIQGGNTSPSSSSSPMPISASLRSPCSTYTYKYFLVQGQCRQVIVSGCNDHGFAQQSECEATCGSARSEREAEEAKIQAEHQKLLDRIQLIDEGQAPPICGLKEAEVGREKRKANHQELIKQGKVPANVPAECSILGGTCFKPNIEKPGITYYLIEGKCRLTKIKSCNIYGFIRRSDCEAACHKNQ